MTTYQLSTKFFSRYRKRWYQLLGAFFILFSGYSFIPKIDVYPAVVLLITFLVFLICVAIAAAISLQGAFKKHQKMWSNYQLIVEENSITRIQNGLSNTTIHRDEIAKIIEILGFCLVIHSRNKTYIIVPDLLEDYQNLRATLAEWSVIEIRQFWVRFIFCLALGILPWVVISAIAKVFHNRFLTAGALSVFLICLIVASITSIRTNPNLSRIQKADLLRGLVLICSILGGALILLLRG